MLVVVSEVSVVKCTAAGHVRGVDEWERGASQQTQDQRCNT